MEENIKLIESLLDRVTDYGKTSYEIVKLKTIDKTVDVVSSFIPPIIFFVFFLFFLLFANFGLAFWLGEIFGKVYFGFLIVAAFYALVVLVLRLFLHKWIKKIAFNQIIKLILK